MDKNSSPTSPFLGPGGWRYHGRGRPLFALEPAPGQESVWDYPRPPRIDAEIREVVVRVGDVEVARTRRALRVLETASPPTVYIPRSDVATEYLQPAPGSSRCEWKGTARYWTLSVPPVPLNAVGWSYDDPLPAFEAIRTHLSFYPARIECYVDGVKVRGSRAASTAAGSHQNWSVPSRETPARVDGRLTASRPESCRIMIRAGAPP